MVAAFLAFTMAKALGPGAVAIVGASCILIASLMLLPEIRANWHKKWGET
jgi:hypothetical protein